jgi:hypothetical protein
VFENRVLRRIFRPKRDEVTGGWRKLRSFITCTLHQIYKMDLREIGWDGMDWIDLARNGDRWRDVVNTVMNLLVP